MSLRLPKFMPVCEKIGNWGPYGPKFAIYGLFFNFFDLQAPKRYARAIRLIKKCHVFVKKCHVIPLARPYEHLAYFRQKDRTL